MASNELTADQIYVKKETGEIEGPYFFRATFNNILSDKDGVGLDQFYQDYVDFMSQAFFMHVGPEQPTNTHMGIWIDTSETNADQIGLVDTSTE